MSLHVVEIKEVVKMEVACPVSRPFRLFRAYKYAASASGIVALVLCDRRLLEGVALSCVPYFHHHYAEH